MAFSHILIGICALPMVASFLFFPTSCQNGMPSLRSSNSGAPTACFPDIPGFFPRAIKHTSASVLRVADLQHRSNIASTGRISHRHGGVRGIVAETPQLKDVVLPKCKRLCPGCEPWICPLAPKDSQRTEVLLIALRCVAPRFGS